MENMEWKIPFIDLDTTSGKTFHSICSKVNSDKKQYLKYNKSVMSRSITLLIYFYNIHVCTYTRIQRVARLIF